MAKKPFPFKVCERCCTGDKGDKGDRGEKGDKGDALTISRTGTGVVDYFQTDASLWENGSLSAGENISDGSKIRLRTIGKLPIDPSYEYTINIPSEKYKVELDFFASETASKASLTTSYLFNGDKYTLTNSQLKWVRILIAEVSNASMTPEDVAGMGISITRKEDVTECYSVRNIYKNTIKLMTFNVGQFYNGTTRCPDNEVDAQISRYKALITKYQPDFICTQETPKYVNVGNSVLGSSFFDERYSHYVCTGGDIGSAMGLAYITNCNLVDIEQRALSNDRPYTKAYTHINGIKVAIYNTHLSFENQETRAPQIAELLAEVQTEEYAIIFGDFNTGNVNGGVSELTPFIDAGYKLGNLGALGNLSTCVNGGRTDNIIVSPNITLCKAEVEDELFESLNDHRPFVLTVEIGENTVDYPTENGTYTLQLTINNGVKTYRWVQA